MRHRKSGKKLGRDRQGRRALLRNLAVSLLRHDRVVTTEARALALRQFIGRLATSAQKNTLSGARQIHSELQHPIATREMIDRVAGRRSADSLLKFTKAAIRHGDGARLGILEWVAAPEAKKPPLPVSSTPASSTKDSP